MQSRKLILPEKNTSVNKLLIIILAIVATIFAVLFFRAQGANKVPTNTNYTAAAMYSLDINPSIEIFVDESKEVIQVKSLNEDGKFLLKHVNCMGMDIIESLEMILDKSVELGYLDENSKKYVLISEIMLSNEFISIKSEVESFKDKKEMNCIFLSGDSEHIEKALANKVSVGKEIFCEKAKEIGIEITKNDAAEKSIDQLMQSNNENAKKLIDFFKEYEAPVLTADSGDKYIKLSWDKIENPDFKGYKIVISRKNTNPAYPEDGYLVYITDNETTTYMLDNVIPYHSGDFGEYLEDGETYYVSITAVYSNEFVTGNSISIEFSSEVTNEEENSGDTNSTSDSNSESNSETNSETNSGTDSESGLNPTGEPTSQPTSQPTPKPTSKPTLEPTPKPTVKPTIEAGSYPSSKITGKILADGTVKLIWDRISSENFSGYKVVASSTNPNPVYPADGYIAWITNRDTNYLAVNSSFLGKLKSGTAYYFSITVVYKDRKVAGNSIKLEYNVEENPDDFKSATITGKYLEDGRLKLIWDKIYSSNFSGYKVVASATNPNPVYPADGYITWITDCEKNYLILDSSVACDLTKGEEYYFSITVVYSDRKVPGNAIKMEYTGDCSK